MTLTAIAMAGIVLGFIVILIGFIVDEQQHPQRKRHKKVLKRA